MLLTAPYRARRDGQADAVQARSLLCPTPSYQPSTDSGALGSSKVLGQSPGPTPADGFTPPAGFFSELRQTDRPDADPRTLRRRPSMHPSPRTVSGRFRAALRRNHPRDHRRQLAFGNVERAGDHGARATARARSRTPPLSNGLTIQLKPRSATGRSPILVGILRAIERPQHADQHRLARPRRSTRAARARPAR